MFRLSDLPQEMLIFTSGDTQKSHPLGYWKTNFSI